MACMPEATLEGTETSSSLGGWQVEMALHFVQEREMEVVIRPFSRQS